MRILLISCVFVPEPVVSAYISADIAEKLSADNEVTVICPIPTRPLGYEFRNKRAESTNNGYRKIYIKSYTGINNHFRSRFFENVFFGIHAMNYLFKNKAQIDIVYQNSWPLFSQLLIVLSGNILKIPVITHVQDIYPESLLNKIPQFLRALISRFFLWFDVLVLRKSNKVVTISPEMKNYLTLSRRLDGDKVEVVYNWNTNSPMIYEDKKNKYITEDFVFLFLGSLSRSADLTNVIRAFANYESQSAKLKIVGSGAEKNRLIREIELIGDSRITLVDYNSNVDYYSSSQVLLISLVKDSSNYALPSKLISYFAVRKPIIATADSGSSLFRIIRDSRSGWLAKAGCQDSLIEAFKKAENEKVDVLCEMGLNGFNYGKHYFSREINITKMCEIIIGQNEYCKET